jgi:hypothetical protein
VYQNRQELDFLETIQYCAMGTRHAVIGTRGLATMNMMQSVLPVLMPDAGELAA